MTDIIDAATAGNLAYTLAGGGAVMLVKWLLGGKARQLEALPDDIQQLQMDIVRLTARMDKAQEDIANDKAGRRAFAEAQAQLASISATINHHTDAVTRIEQGVRDLWTQITKIRAPS